MTRTETITITIRTNPRLRPLRLLLVLGCQVGVIGIGVLAGSAAMQWAGLAILGLLFIAIAASIPSTSNLTIAQARAELDRIEKLADSEVRIVPRPTSADTPPPRAAASGSGAAHGLAPVVHMPVVVHNYSGQRVETRDEPDGRGGRQMVMVIGEGTAARSQLDARIRDAARRPVVVAPR